MYNLVAVLGALAIDQVAATATNFDSRVLNCKLHTLGEHTGGCAGNISYNLALLEQSNQVISVTGAADDATLLANVNQSYSQPALLRMSDENSARALIITDPHGTQFTAFYPGPGISKAQWRSHVEEVLDPRATIVVQAAQNAELSLTTLNVAQTRAQTAF